MVKFWVGVVSENHVKRGVDAVFARSVMVKAVL